MVGTLIKTNIEKEKMAEKSTMEEEQEEMNVPNEGKIILFTEKMKQVTRDTHSLSDKLVDTKMIFALRCDEIWAESLEKFYDIFKYLERAMTRYNHTLIGDLDIPGIRRTEAFEKDLKFYLGNDWSGGAKSCTEVQFYIQHLQRVEKENPYLLIAYIYHLYMGLLFGGQIITQKRKLKFRLGNLIFNKQTTEGYAITDFGTHTVSRLRRDLKQAMNEIADKLDEDTKDQILRESIEVFQQNNVIIRSIKGVDYVVLKFCFNLVVTLYILYFLYNFIFSFIFDK